MGNFSRDRGGNRGGSRSGGFNRGGDRGGSRGGGFNRRDDGPTMHKAICDDCGKSCEIPFQPSGDKPVYCRDCFDKRGGKEVVRGRGGDRDRDRDFDREMFSVTCDECGKRCEVPFKPSSNKPVYCSECFGQKEDGRDRDNRRSDRNDGPRPQASSSELTDALKGINDKLDRLLRALELRSKPEAPVDYKAKQEVVAPKAEKIVAEKPVKAKKAVAAPKKEVKKVAKKKAKAE